MTDPADLAPDAAEWDERYGSSAQVWSGDPNGALVAQVGAVSPGRALDVGCGEGADAVWLARRGWRVTALDVSRVALDRAERHAHAAGVEVTWIHAGLLEAALPLGAFDLVSAQYPVLRRTPGAVAERALLDAVAPGGSLLVVHHVLDAGARHADGHEAGPNEGHGHGHDRQDGGGFDPALYVLPDDVAALLDDEWQVVAHERRPRSVRGGGGAHHVEDDVLHARRR